ncbi:MAG: NnrU family protein [Halieaceae bacterium]
MLLLVIGVLLFAGVHLLRGLAPELRQQLWDKLGEGGYKGLFSLLIISSIALMVFGWRSAIPQFLYAAPLSFGAVSLLLIAFGFLLFVVSGRQSRLRRVIRHPQLTGVTLWAITHLLLNGDSRSVVLFGGLALWSVLEMLVINRREGAWVKEEAPGWGTEVVSIAIAVVAVGIVIYVHRWIAGVAIM